MTSRRPPTARRKAAAPPASRHPERPPLTRSEEAAIERLRAICLALPEATEKVAWGELTWRAGKIFAQMDTHHHGADHVAVWLPARPGVQEALVEEDPVRYFRPPYVGPKGWVGVRIDRKPDWRAVAGLVAEAYREVASPRLRARLDRQRDAQVARPRRGWRAKWLDDGEPPVD